MRQDIAWHPWSSGAYVTALVACLLTLASCGHDGRLPAGVIASVGDTPIHMSEFSRRFNPVMTKMVLDGPQGDKLRQLGRRTTVEALVDAEWIEREAKAEHIKVSSVEVRGWYQAQRDAAARAAAIGGDNSAYKLRVQIARGAETHRRSEGRVTLLRDKLIARAVGDLPTPAVLRNYYATHRRQFIRPEQRTLRLVLAKHRADADRATRLLRQGETWVAVSRLFAGKSSDARERPKPTTVVRNALPPDLGDELFMAPLGRTRGPVKIGNVWYVYEIGTSIPSRRVPFKVARSSISSQMSATKTAAASAALKHTLRRKYRPITHCAAHFLVSRCS